MYILVKEFITDFKLDAISPKEFNKSIPVFWRMDSGVNVTVDVSHNGIQCCSAGPLSTKNGQCNCLISNPYYGTVTISASAVNHISGPKRTSTNVKVLQKNQFRICNSLSVYLCLFLS